MTNNKPLTKEEIAKRNCGYGNWEGIYKAMDEWADIKLGEFISKQTSFTETTVVPKYILDEYAKKEASEFNKWANRDWQYMKDATGDNDIWTSRHWHNGKPVEVKTLEDLYTLYLESKK